jgi:hypothetical protein
MAIDTASVAEKVFNILKGHGYSVQSYNKEGKIEVDPREATRFAVGDPNILVRMDLNTETISLSTSEDLSDHPVRKMLKNLANDYLMSFDYRVFGKKLKPKGETMNIAQNSEKDMADVMEGFGSLTGSTKTSYQPLDSVKIVVRHKKPVNEEIRGSRSRNIHSILIQKGEERFKMQENNLKAARAMARHINNGGEMFDSIGQTITEMAAEYRKLQEFVRYVRSAKLINEDNEQYVTLAMENIENIKYSFEKIAGTKTYASAVESLQDRYSVEINETSFEDLESKFVETHFDNKVSDAMASIKRALVRQQTFEAAILEAIDAEDFSNLRSMLEEGDVVEFATPHARLGYQVAQMGYAAQNETLRNHLNNISKKLEAGNNLNQFEYTTVKSCLLSAHEAKVKTPGSFDESKKYEDFLNSFIIK